MFTVRREGSPGCFYAVHLLHSSEGKSASPSLGRRLSGCCRRPSLSSAAATRSLAVRQRLCSSGASPKLSDRAHPLWHPGLFRLQVGRSGTRTALHAGKAIRPPSWCGKSWAFFPCGLWGRMFSPETERGAVSARSWRGAQPVSRSERGPRSAAGTQDVGVRGLAGWGLAGSGSLRRAAPRAGSWLGRCGPWGLSPVIRNEDAAVGHQHLPV